MTKTLYDPEVEKNAKKEIAKNMKKKGMDIDLILEITGLTKKELSDI